MSSEMYFVCAFLKLEHNIYDIAKNFCLLDIHTEEIMIYEEVTQIMADFDRPRPILITGKLVFFMI